MSIKAARTDKVTDVRQSDQDFKTHRMADVGGPLCYRIILSNPMKLPIKLWENGKSIVIGVIENHAKNWMVVSRLDDCKNG